DQNCFSDPTHNQHTYKYLLHKINKLHSSLTFTPHNQVLVYNRMYNEFIEIDTNIAELMCRLWYEDIETISSCENNVSGNHIWIHFMGSEVLNKFMHIVFDGIDKSEPIYKRVFSTES